MIPLEFRKPGKLEIRKTGNREIRKSGKQEIWKSGNQEIWKTENLEVRKSGNQEIRKSGNQENRKSGNQETRKLGKQEIRASLGNSHRAILLHFAFKRRPHHAIIPWEWAPEICFLIFSLEKKPHWPHWEILYFSFGAPGKIIAIFQMFPLGVRREQSSFILPSKGGPTKQLLLIYWWDFVII